MLAPTVSIICTCISALMFWIAGFFYGEHWQRKRLVKFLPSEFLRCKNCLFYDKSKNTGEGVCCNGCGCIDRSDDSKACKDFEVKTELVKHG
jgi:hypothetical protein